MSGSRQVRERLVGRSPAMQRVGELVERVQAGDTPVLVQGATGTGKELVARAIHAGSARRRGPLVTIDCGALPVSLAESEIFGYRRGAFTDAQRDKAGLIEKANGGTLFIDEIGDIALDLQAKLLRFLQEGEVRRIGDLRPTRTDIRVIAATNRDLRERIEQGGFRLDLFYRLNVVTIDLPTLAERREDIPLLAEHFLDLLRRESGSERLALSDDALQVLMAHSWPGNVRELENTLRGAAVQVSGGVIQASDLPERIRGELLACELSLRDHERQAADRVARQLLVRALERSGGDVQEAATMLRTPVKTVYHKLKRLGIQPASFRKSTGESSS